MLTASFGGGYRNIDQQFRGTANGGDIIDARKAIGPSFCVQTKTQTHFEGNDKNEPLHRFVENLKFFSVGELSLPDPELEIVTHCLQNHCSGIQQLLSKT